MAADSCAYARQMRYPSARPKILRCAAGLVGCAGVISDIMQIQAWAAGGMRKQKLSLAAGDGEDETLWVLWAKPDGTVWYADHQMVFVQESAPVTIGEGSACAFAEGAMAAGASAERAVRLATRHCLYASGKVQVERL